MTERQAAFRAEYRSRISPSKKGAVRRRRFTPRADRGLMLVGGIFGAIAALPAAHAAGDTRDHARPPGKPENVGF